MKKKNIGILFGGMSTERDISLLTGQAVYNALKTRGYQAKKILVDRDIDQTLRQSEIDVAFLALHGRLGEDGCVQGMLEMMGIPYTGSGVLASSLAMNKVKAKELFRLHNVPTPPYYVLNRDQIDDLEEIHGSFGFPAIVKPVTEGSSNGISIANSFESLTEAVERALKFDDSLLVERFARGKEVSVAIIDNRVLGAVEVEPVHQFYDHHSKYQSNECLYHLPARLNQVRYQGVLNLAKKASQSIGCTEVSRVDLIVTEGDNEYVLEVNTLPGLTPTSLLPKIAESAGMDFGDLCETILRGAKLHCRMKNSLFGEKLNPDAQWTEGPHMLA